VVPDVITVSGLSKRYKHGHVLEDVSFEVRAGSICGLIGRNGAGKTTVLKCVVGLARPSAGTISIDGAPVGPATFRKLAYVADARALYDGLTVEEHLHVAERSSAAFDLARAADLLDVFQLARRSSVRRLSRGQRTGLALLIAFASRPSIVVLDEPTSDLDPILQRVVLELVIEAASSGAAVLLSSHQIGHLEQAADHILVLHQSRIALDAEVETLRREEKVVEAFFDSAAPDAEAVRAQPGVRRAESSHTSSRAFVAGSAEALQSWYRAGGAREVRIVDRNLEEVFLDIVDEPRGGIIAR
jgi:ABC-2 type transport system ATP-binding protein